MDSKLLRQFVVFLVLLFAWTAFILLVTPK